MSIPLPPRGACTLCADCAAFVVGVLDPVTQTRRPCNFPSTAQEACTPCGHSYLSHAPPPIDVNDRNFHMRRGPCARTGCAGFATSIVCDFDTVCTCGAPWGSHGDPPALPTNAPLAPSAPPSVPGPLAPPFLGTLGPPVESFRGVPAPIQGSAGTRRMASANRSLPHGPFAAAGANHSGPRHNFPSGAPPKATVYIMFWPNSDHGLYFSVQIPPAGPTSVAEFSRFVVGQLQARQFSLQQCPDGTLSGASSDDLDGQLWELLNRRPYGDVYTYSIHPSINDASFGFQEFKKIQKLKNPLNPDELWIFLGGASPLLSPISVLILSSQHLALVPWWGPWPIFQRRLSLSAAAILASVGVF
ncbi:hypothetical protein DFH07DRAFT_783492 [Mycena maculata]|uniref:Uncharacterized protein n=1 Tax=Mycena maculata TaxID=230809 RepID=A0AAD7HM61_9AGAR|nr:hypothetical protein DFH07DRAFT_783492 [Mycena maculata]